MTYKKMDWSKPSKINDVTLAFPANIIGELLPLEADLPKEFRDLKDSPFVKIASDWFYGDLTQKRYEDLKPREGIIKDDAARHLKACLGSYQPSHEHKLGGVAYLMSLWFEPELTGG